MENLQAYGSMSFTCFYFSGSQVEEGKGCPTAEVTKAGLPNPCIQVRIAACQQWLDFSWLKIMGTVVLAGCTDDYENKTLGEHLSFCQRGSLSVPRGGTAFT